MRPPVLAVLLALCGVLAVYPATVWSFAAIFDIVDDRWRLLLSHSMFTVPLALALSSILLTLHGLRTNALFQEEAAEEFNEFRERELAAVGAAAAAGAAGGDAGMPGAGTAGPAAPAGAMVAASANPRSGGDAGGRGSRNRASTGNRLRRRAKSMASRQIRRRTGFY